MADDSLTSPGYSLYLANTFQPNDFVDNTEHTSCMIQCALVHEVSTSTTLHMA